MPTRRFSAHWLWVPLLPFLLAAWLLGSESGLRFAAATIEWASAGNIAIDGAKGRLAGAMHFASLRYGDPKLSLAATNVDLDWQPLPLLRGKLIVDVLAASQLDIARRASPEPLSAPADLHLPLAFDIARLAVDHLNLRDIDAPAAAPTLSLAAIDARLASDGETHRIEALHVASAQVALDGSATLAANAPFALRAEATLAGEEAGHPFKLKLAATGPLAGIALKLASDGDTLRGDGAAVLTPFAPQPFREARLRLSGVDPAAWIEGAPQARLDLAATLAPENGAVAGRIDIDNRLSGPLDRERLPLKRLDSGLEWRGASLKLKALQAEFDGGGRIVGSAQWDAGRLRLDARVLDIDAARIHSRLKPTRLGGSLQAAYSDSSQRLEADLGDPRFALRLSLEKQGPDIRAERLRLTAGPALFEASGQLSLDAAKAFALKGRLAHFDPSRYAHIPSAQLNADIDANGTLAPTAAKVHFALKDSRIAGKAATGHGDLAIDGQRLQHADLLLALGDNRIDAKGSFGAPGDALTLAIDAPKLEQIGLGGDFKAEGRIAGAPSDPSGSLKLSSTNLTLPGAYRLAGLTADLQLGAGANGRLAGRVALARLDAPQRAALLAAASLILTGSRARHALNLKAALAGQRTLALLADGGVENQRGRWQWQGRLARLELGGEQPLALARPTPLRLAADEIELGAADLRGPGWDARIEMLHWQPARLETRGRIRHLPLAALNIAAPTPSTLTLTLGAEWELAAEAHVNGRLRLFREGGDLTLDTDPPQALGLTQLQLDLKAQNDRLSADLQLNSRLAGTLSGQAALLATRSAAGWQAARLEPWQGSLRLDTPALDWLGPLLGGDARTGGALKGQLALGGTPAAPRLSGRIDGRALALKLAAQGIALDQGSLRLDFDQDVARLTHLEFASRPGVPPGDDRIDAALAKTPGKLEASGEIALATKRGSVDFKLERVGALQRRDQWLQLSGHGRLRLEDDTASLGGQLAADGCFFGLPPAGAPKLGDDVTIVGRAPPEKRPLRIDLDLEADLGQACYFHGAGVDTRIAGTLRVKAENHSPPRASGSVSTVGGNYDAYGQKLAIERGILNFHGLIDNPGLNIRAVRKNQPVEAGVEVGGTVKKPEVKLVSTPDLPDNEKLSWMVLGRGPDQSGGADTGLLLAAASAIFGGQSDGTVKSLQRSLGVDVAIKSGQLDASGQPIAGSRVASAQGFSQGQTVNGQIVSIGKRLSSNAMLSYEQSLSATESIVKLTVFLNRRLSLIARAGTDTALDLFYTFPFGH